MAKVLGGKVKVPTSQCAINWHEFLWFVTSSRDLGERLKDEDLKIVKTAEVRAYMGYLASLFPNNITVADVGTLKSYGNLQEFIAQGQVPDAQKQLQLLRDELTPKMIEAILDCECSQRK